MVRTATVFVFVVLLGAGAAVGEGKPSADGGRHLFVVPSDGAPAVALAKTEARVVARYRAFDLVEASGEDADRLSRAGADRRDDMRRVRIGRRSLDPARGRRALTGKRRGPTGPGFAVVQFIGPIKDAWLARLRKTGVRVVTYMAQNGYLVHGSADELDRAGSLVGADPAVRAAVPYTAADKVAAGVKSSGEQRLAVQTLSGDDGAAARSEVGAAGRELRDASAVGPFRNQYVMADVAGTAELARDPGVVAILPSPAPQLRDEAQDQILAGNTTGTDPLLPSGPGYLAFIDPIVGSSTFPFSVDVTDEGIDFGVVGTTHPDLHVDGVVGNPTRLDYVDDFTTDTGVNAARDCGGHGTINAGIVGGFNNGSDASLEDANGFNYGLGLAPRTKLGGSKIFTCAGSFSLTSTFTALTTNAYTKGARISSNSWGADTGGAYDADSQEYDKLVRDADPGLAGNQEMVEVFAAGNAGSGPSTVGAPGTAKNVLTVGASENVRAMGAADGCGITDSGADDAHDVIDFSSRGPTADARIKPDIVGPGTHIVDTKPQHAGYTGGGVCTGSFPAGSTLYSESSGTSHSTPALAGAAALVRQWYVGGPGSGIAPSPALTKAIIAQSGTDLVGGASGAGAGTNTNVPDQVQGWGLMNLTRALDLVGSRFFRDQQDIFAATGDSFTQVFAVSDTSKPVRVTLAFTDIFGPTSGNSFVNDLNLNVATGAGTFKGNVFSGGLSAPGGTADPRNNIESVYLPAGTSGSFSVTIDAANIAGDGVPGNADATDQDFALAVSNAAVTSSPVLQQVSNTVTDQGDADGAIEPGENFGITDTIKNSGNAGATGISGTLSGPGTVTFPDGTAAWPDLAAGASAQNSDPLVGGLSAGAACGAPVTVTLQITSTQGAGTTVPVTFDTGAAGAPVASNSTDVPKSIPDNNPAGVNSTLNVAATGNIKDVNVRIGGLTHTWVGDLKIDITSPGATTVNLANRPGGVNNSGNNFTNTVFDDEAGAPIGTGAPYTGSFRPQADQLSRFDGESQTGTWTLNVADLAAVDIGTLNNWGHDISPAVCDFSAPSPPGAIANLTATGQVEAVALEWDDTATATGYKVYRKAGGVYPGTPTATPSSSNFTDTGRTAGVQECYKVQATNTGGDGPMSGEVCATPLPQAPGVITGLVSAPGVELVALDWTDTPTASDYYVWRLNPDGSTPALPTATVTPSQHIDTGRPAGLQQCYKVQAHNATGSGPLSSQTCATPQAQGGGGGGGGGGNQLPILPKLDLSGIPGTVKVDSKGKFTLEFSATANSAGRLRLTTVKSFAAAAKKKKKSKQKVASKGFTAGADGAVTLKLKLKLKHLKLLKKAKKLKVSAKAVDGGLSSSRTFRLKAPKPKKKKKR